MPLPTRSKEADPDHTHHLLLHQGEGGVGTSDYQQPQEQKLCFRNLLMSIPHGAGQAEASPPHVSLTTEALFN